MSLIILNTLLVCPTAIHNKGLQICRPLKVCA